MSFKKNLENTCEDLIATYQNLAQNKNLQIDFDQNFVNNFFSWNQNIIAHQPPIIKAPSPNENLINLSQIRPSLDLAICYKLFHDLSIHDKFRPQQNKYQNFDLDFIKLFDDFEKIRVMANSKNQYRGIVLNLINKIKQDLIFCDSNNFEMIFFAKFFNEFIDKKTQEYFQNLFADLSSKIIKKIQQLNEFTNNQIAFANQVNSIIDDLYRQQNSPPEILSKSAPNKSDNSQEKNDDLVNHGEEKLEEEQSQISDDNPSEVPLIPDNISSNNFSSQEFLPNISANSQILDSRNSNREIEFYRQYQIYTRNFDEIIYPKKFVSKNELEALRKQLDLKISKLNNISKKMAIKLQRKLLSKKNNYFDRDATGGVLNRKKFANLIISPLTEDIWVNLRSHEYNDTALTILLDNSGSMRGNPIVMSAMACEIIAEILEKFSIKTEIIGFTTADWRGGRVKKQWEMSGREKNPGRLNEIRHIIYKSFNQSFKKSKINLALMLKEGILKENIDGEALLFARSRLMQQNENRKILMVISDGTPVDDSTAHANEGDILSDHLRLVINSIEKQGKIEIIGIGIGHSTDDFYKNSITIKSLEDLGDVMIDKLINVL
jgi:cobaltochelatase CobT